MKSLSFLINNYIFKPAISVYLKNDLNTRYKGFKIKILAGVFHPKLFFSTSYLYEFLSGKNMAGSHFLEIGCGSGVLSLMAYNKGAHVTALDIDSKALENTKINFVKNFGTDHKAVLLQSNLFTNLPEQLFDMVVINPPYYFKRVQSAAHYAWYCGEDGEYFEGLFNNLKKYTRADSKIYMVLEENCDIERIKSIAQRHEVEMTCIDERQIKWEKNYIFGLVAS